MNFQVQTDLANYDAQLIHQEISQLYEKMEFAFTMLLVANGFMCMIVILTVAFMHLRILGPLIKADKDSW